MSNELNETEPRYRSFSLGEVLFFATGGRVVSPLHQTDLDSLLDFATYVSGVDDLTNLELSYTARECQAGVIAQYPELAAIAEKFETGETDALWQSCHGNRALWHEKLAVWLDAQQTVPGELLTIVPLPEFQRDPRPIMEQAVDIAGEANMHKLFVGHVDNDGGITFPK